jgi:hypothetical protein
LTVFCKAADETGVELEKAGRKMVPRKGSEIGCLELLDDRRYTTTLKPGCQASFCGEQPAADFILGLRILENDIARTHQGKVETDPSTGSRGRNEGGVVTGDTEPAQMDNARRKPSS